MRNTILSGLTLLILCSNIYGQTKDLNIDFMLRGSIYAGSNILDTQALGGFGSSENLPQKMNDSLKFPEQGLFLKIDNSNIVTFIDQ